jgi:hypothetical protein
MLTADSPLASAEDMNIPQCATSAEEAVALIRKHHNQWLQQSAKSSAKKQTRKK